MLVDATELTPEMNKDNFQVIDLVEDIWMLMSYMRVKVETKDKIFLKEYSGKEIDQDAIN